MIMIELNRVWYIENALLTMNECMAQKPEYTF